MLHYRHFVQLVSDDTINHVTLQREKKIIADIEQNQKIDFILNDLPALIHESKDGANRVTKLVGSLRSLAKTGTENEMAYNDLTQIVEEALLIVKHEMQSIAVINKQLESPLHLLCNKGQIGQVMLTLLLNAVHALKSQNRSSLGEITLTTSHFDPYIICSISDDGPGIKEEYMNRIFDPFFTTKDVGSGVGLGLSVAYDIIVKKHGGEFLVASQLNKGTSFTIKLPIHGVQKNNAGEL